MLKVSGKFLEELCCVNGLNAVPVEIKYSVPASH